MSPSWNVVEINGQRTLYGASAPVRQERSVEDLQSDLEVGAAAFLDLVTTWGALPAPRKLIAAEATLHGLRALLAELWHHQPEECVGKLESEAAALRAHAAALQVERDRRGGPPDAA